MIKNIDAHVKIDKQEMQLLERKTWIHISADFFYYCYKKG